MSIWFVVRIEVSVSYFLTNRMNQDCIKIFFQLLVAKAETGNTVCVVPTGSVAIVKASCGMQFL